MLCIGLLRCARNDSTFGFLRVFQNPIESKNGLFANIIKGNQAVLPKLPSSPILN